MFELRWQALRLSDVNVCNWVKFPPPLLIFALFRVYFCAEQVNLLCCGTLKLWYH